MIAKSIKIILFTSLIVAMILPFSAMDFAEAKPNENASDTAKDKINEKYRNSEAEEIYAKLIPYLLETGDEEKTFTSEELKEFKKLQKALEKSQKDHKEKNIDKDLRNDLKEAKKEFLKSDIPFKIVAVGFDELHIQLSPDDYLQYKSQIAEILEGIPYTLESGEGMTPISCSKTTSRCSPEIGGIKITSYAVNKTWIHTDDVPNALVTNKLTTKCSLSIPMTKNGVLGFLTAAHCMDANPSNVYLEPTSVKVYQPSKKKVWGYVLNYIGYAKSSTVSFGSSGSLNFCDVAWIKDKSPNPSKNAIYFDKNKSWRINDVRNPELGDSVNYRGYISSSTGVVGDMIVRDSVSAYYEGRMIHDLMGITNMFGAIGGSQAVFGDSGGAVFYNGEYLGMIISTGTIDGRDAVYFMPWDHIDQCLSGLELAGKSFSLQYYTANGKNYNWPTDIAYYTR